MHICYAYYLPNVGWVHSIQITELYIYMYVYVHDVYTMKSLFFFQTRFFLIFINVAMILI